MALHTQFLTTPNGTSPAVTPDTVVALVTALGYVQIDALKMVSRAHYVTFGRASDRVTLTTLTG